MEPGPAHPDHYGLIEAAPAVPVLMGGATARILKEAAFFTPMGVLQRPVDDELIDHRPVKIGSFVVTPFLVDYSAFDAYALLVEADGSRLFYTGDFRAHGRKTGAFRALVEDPPEEIDVLLLEGTTISRNESGAPFSEEDVEVRLRQEIQKTDGLFLACYSAQNIDRLVSVYRAVIQEDRDLVIDPYGASIAAATGRDTVPQTDWGRIRVYVPQSQRVKVKRAEEFWRVDELGASRIYLEEIAEDPSRWVMSFRTSMAAELDRAGLLTGSSAAWMMWPGYLEGADGERTRDAFTSRGIPLPVIHASGHASAADLQVLARAISPGRIVPIHTTAAGRYPDLFEDVEAHVDGEWWDV